MLYGHLLARTTDTFLWPKWKFKFSLISTIHSSRTQLKWIIFIFKIRKKNDCCFWLTFSLEVQTNRLNIVQSHQVTLNFYGNIVTLTSLLYILTEHADIYAWATVLVGTEELQLLSVMSVRIKQVSEKWDPTISLEADGNCRFISFQFNKKYVHVYKITCNT